MLINFTPLLSFATTGDAHTNEGCAYVGAVVDIQRSLFEGDLAEPGFEVHETWLANPANNYVSNNTNQPVIQGACPTYFNYQLINFLIVIIVYTPTIPVVSQRAGIDGHEPKETLDDEGNI